MTGRTAVTAPTPNSSTATGSPQPIRLLSYHTDMPLRRLPEVPPSPRWSRVPTRSTCSGDTTRPSGTHVPSRVRWAILLTNKLYYTRDRAPLTGIRNSFRGLAFT